MSRYTGPRTKIIRRLGNLPGLTSKSPSHKKVDSKKKSSQYGIRLETKQKLRFYYGITEKQIIRYIKKARSLKGSTGKLLLKLLEMRLDNVLFRAGLTTTIPASRQLITHGHILVNDQQMNIPSYQCRPQDQITIKSVNLTKNLFIRKEVDFIPSHLSLSNQKQQITILNNFQHQEVGLNLNELLIIEYYSRS